MTSLLISHPTMALTLGVGEKPALRATPREPHVHSEVSREMAQSKDRQGQAYCSLDFAYRAMSGHVMKRMFVLVCAIVLLGSAAYLVAENIGKQSVDRNVPGATTGPGRKSLADE
jgi:hypothetical protein